MKRITAFSRDHFREWLVNNHDKEDKVSIIVYKKHTGKPSPSHRELMEEAICFGWIDTTVKRLDEDRYQRFFSKRTKNSRWSDNTLMYAKNLIKQKKMTLSGLRFYKEGLKRPTHDAGIPKNPAMPSELKTALAKNKKANETFRNFPPSAKKMFYRWLLRGKLKETRDKRIKLIIEKARQGKRVVFGSQKNING